MTVLMGASHVELWIAIVRDQKMISYWRRNQPAKKRNEVRLIASYLQKAKLSWDQIDAIILLEVAQTKTSFRILKTIAQTVALLYPLTIKTIKINKLSLETIRNITKSLA